MGPKKYDLQPTTWLIPLLLGLTIAFAYGPWEQYRWLMNVRGGLGGLAIGGLALLSIRQFIAWGAEW
jgi:hypothetical protein